MNSETLISSIFQTPIGNLEVVHDERFLYSSCFSTKSALPLQGRLAPQIATELESYFSDPKHVFQLPLKPQGTPFQLKVGHALRAIVSGTTISYGELAKELESGPRAIGQACRKNPLPLFIPCHRIVGKNDLGGYLGKEHAISYKRSLLNHESDCKLIRVDGF